jgi:hypothetical protein
MPTVFLSGDYKAKVVISVDDKRPGDRRTPSAAVSRVPESRLPLPS